MKIDPNVLQQLVKSFGVSPAASIGNIQGIIQQCEKAPSKYEPILTGNNYQWDDYHNAYVNGDQKIYFFAEKKLFIWIWSAALARLLQGTEMLIKWVQGNEKYPEGKANSFMQQYLQMTGQKGAAPSDKKSHIAQWDGTSWVQKGAAPGAKKAPVNRMDLEDPEPDEDPLTGPVPDRSGVAPPSSEADAIIRGIMTKAGINPGTKLSKQAPIRMSSDQIIDLYQQTKEMSKTDPEGAKKLLDFIKTIKPNPLKTENIVKKSDLERLIQEIVKGVIKEVKKKTAVADPGDDDDDAEFWQVKSKPEDNDRQWIEDFANKMWKDPRDIGRGGQGLKWRIIQSKTADGGEVVYHLGKTKTVELSKFIIKKGDDWFYLEQDPQTKVKKWVKMSEKPVGQVKMDEPIVPEEPEIDEMTGTAAVSPISTPNAFKKTSEKYDHDDPNAGDENYQDTSMLSNCCGAPKRADSDICSKCGEHADFESEESLTEITTTMGGTPGYNVPGAFSRRGGSKAGLAGSAALGYELTPIGKKEMQRTADKLLEGKNKPLSHAKRFATK